MKKFLFAVGAVLYCLLIGAQAHAQQNYTTVYDLYFYTTLNPETGDQQIQMNQAHFDEQFFTCLSQVQQRYEQAAQRQMNYCNGLANPQRRAKCHNENEAAKMVGWIKMMRSVTQGQIIWSQTFLGQVALLAKKKLEEVAPGKHEEIVRKLAPSQRPMMVCQ